MQTATNPASEQAFNCLAAFDDVDQHIAYEYHPDCYQGLSTIGFAHIAGIDGRKSFYIRCKQLANDPTVDQVTTDRRGDIRVDVGTTSFRISEAYDGGRRMSLTNVRDFQPGPEHQRLDVRERLHSLALNRFRYNGYLQEARVSSRVD